MYYMIDDEKTERREAFIANEEMADQCLENYSGYFIIKEFKDEYEAKTYCNKYNNYKLDSDKNSQ